MTRGRGTEIENQGNDVPYGFATSRTVGLRGRRKKCLLQGTRGKKEKPKSLFKAKGVAMVERKSCKSDGKRRNKSTGGGGRTNPSLKEGGVEGEPSARAGMRSGGVSKTTFQTMEKEESDWPALPLGETEQHNSQDGGKRMCYPSHPIRLKEGGVINVGFSSFKKTGSQVLFLEK